MSRLKRDCWDFIYKPYTDRCGTKGPPFGQDSHLKALQTFRKADEMGFQRQQWMLKGRFINRLDRSNALKWGDWVVDFPVSVFMWRNYSGIVFASGCKESWMSSVHHTVPLSDSKALVLLRRFNSGDFGFHSSLLTIRCTLLPCRWNIEPWEASSGPFECHGTNMFWFPEAGSFGQTL